MKTTRIAYFKDFQIYQDAALNFYHALKECKKQGINKLIVEKAVYELDPEGCAQKNLNISNHGFNGPKRIGVLIDGMEDFEIDFSGATIMCGGIMTAIAITGSKNITVKNGKIKLKHPQLLQASVVAHGEGYMDIKPLEDGHVVKLFGNKLYSECAEDTLGALHSNIEFNGKTGEIEVGTGDNTLGADSRELTFTYTEDGLLRVNGIKRYPPIGNVVVFYCGRRVGCGIFCEESENIRIEQMTLASCHGMGILGQLCKNVTMDGLCIRPEDGHYYSVSADATHFVNCEGLICMENSTFVGQYDDALNAHGIYSRITDKGADWLLAKEMHFQATGIRIFRPGNKFAVLHPKTLIAYEELTLKEVEYISDTYAKLTFEEDITKVRVGDNLENLTTSPDIIFRNNTVRDNRARGMLLATRGKVLVENNYFHTAGCTVLFESDGEYWFESGSTADVTIRNNVFDRCKYAAWCDAVIQFIPRSEEEEDKYFHEKICIEDNEFILGTNCVAKFDNIENVVFRNNKFKTEAGNEPEITVHHVRMADIQEDVKRK